MFDFERLQKDGATIEVTDAMVQAGVSFLRACDGHIVDEEAMVAELFRTMTLAAAEERRFDTTPT